MKRRSFLKYSASAGLVTLITPSGIVQAFTPDAGNAMEAGFLSPPVQSKPFTWWHWMNGNISKRGITLDLEALKRVGVGGVQCFNIGDGIPTGPVKYLSPEWDELTVHAINEAGRLGMQFDMHNCPGWSSSAGPWITPDKGMQQVCWSQTFVTGGQQKTIELPLPPTLLDFYKDTYVVAYPSLNGEEQNEIYGVDDFQNKANFPRKTKLKNPFIKGKKLQGNIMAAGNFIDPEKVIDLTTKMDKAGRLTWAVPEGKWTILRIGHTVIEQINHAPPTSGVGLECDKYSREAFKFHFDNVFEKLMPVFKKWAPRSKVGLLIDSYEVGLQNWTPTLPGEFKKRRGYDLIKYLPAVAGRIVGDADQTERFLYDFRKTHADLMANNYYGYFAELCKENGLVSYTEPYRNGPFDQIEAGSKVDINMGEFWIRGPFFLPSLKLASSVAHVYGKRVDGLQIVGAEAYTGDPAHSKWQEHPYSLKSQGDMMLTFGLNRFIFHRYAHQPHSTVKPGMTMGPHGFHFERTNTWFEKSTEWLAYLGRCQNVLQKGLFCADILYFGGEDLPGDDLSRMVEFTPEPPVGFDWDRTNKEGLMTRLDIRDNEIVLPDGVRYKMLVLVTKDEMSIETLEKINELVNKGMILVGNPPKVTPGLENFRQNEIRFKSLVSQLWGNGNSPEAKLVGKGKVFREQPLHQVMDKINVKPDCEFSARSGDAMINYIHRRIDNADVYFIANRRRTNEDVTATFRVSNKQPELWDPSTGLMVPLSVYEKADGRTVIPLQLDPCGSCFVVFRQPLPDTNITSVIKSGNTLISGRKFPEKESGRYKTVMDNFTVSAWVKPETDDKLDGEYVGKQISSYLFYPPKGELLYGKGHSACGMVVARNGILVFERKTDELITSLKLPVMLSGWTHIALVYTAGAPSVYVNGQLIGSGEKSANKVHPGVGDFKQDYSAWLFEGDISDLQVTNKALSSAHIAALAAQPASFPDALPDVQLYSGKKGLMFWKNGSFDLTLSSGKVRNLEISGLPEPEQLKSPWKVVFPPDLGAPASTILPELISLHKHKDDGVKYFSGTAGYENEFSVPSAWLGNGNRVFLDLGRVEVIAEVFINGKNCGMLWKPPYRIEITNEIRPGKNAMEVKVTNLWPNRLIGDEQLPQEYEFGYVKNKLAENKEITAGENSNINVGIKALPNWYLQDKPKPKGQRVAFTTWKHYAKDSPLLESGLIGPVMIRVAKHMNDADLPDISK